MKKTARGFNVYSEFRDTYGQKIAVVESSAATQHCVWIQTEARPSEPEAQNNFPHLNKVQARRVAKALLKFADGV